MSQFGPPFDGVGRAPGERARYSLPENACCNDHNNIMWAYSNGSNQLARQHSTMCLATFGVKLECKALMNLP